MGARRKALLLIVASAAAVFLVAGSAFAQKTFIRGPSSSSRVLAPAHGNDGPRGPYRGPGWRGPGVIVVAPGLGVPGGYVVDGDFDGPRALRQQRGARRGPTGAPPAGERRLVPDEVVIELANTVSERQIEALQRQYRLTRVESQRFTLTGTTLYRWHIPDRRSVASVVRSLERNANVVSAQPNYLFTVQEDAAKPAEESDSSQYALAKLHLPQAHALAKGADIRVAVIDSAIDRNNAELAGSVAENFDALSTPFAPHKHGTAVAGLIAAHRKLTGAAPDAKILAVRAFDPSDNGAQGTTFGILKGLEWAATNGARVINMSFAGPNDPAMHRSLAAAHKKGIVLVAAAGNAGAKSPPLYPAADSNVIAVTATDANDKLFEQSNRGKYIDLAAPGSDILVAIPDGYEISSGTSYAAAEVSGIAALMLQRDPALTPERLRHLLETSAKDLGPKGRDAMFGFGLADAYAAVRADAAPVASNAGAR